jgi:hypothetical protein
MGELYGPSGRDSREHVAGVYIKWLRDFHFLAVFESKALERL